MDSDLNTRIIEIAIRKVLKRVYGYTNAEIDRFVDAVHIAAKEIKIDLVKKLKKPTEN
jgi:hypothetical protein